MSTPKKRQRTSGETGPGESLIGTYSEPPEQRRVWQEFLEHLDDDDEQPTALDALRMRDDPTEDPDFVMFPGAVDDDIGVRAVSDREVASLMRSSGPVIYSKDLIVLPPEPANQQQQQQQESELPQQEQQQGGTWKSPRKPRIQAQRSSPASATIPAAAAAATSTTAATPSIVETGADTFLTPMRPRLSTSPFSSPPRDQAMTNDDLAILRRQQQKHVQLLLQMACMFVGKDIEEARLHCQLLEELCKCSSVSTDYKRIMAFCLGEPSPSTAEEGPQSQPLSAFQIPGLEHVPRFVALFRDQRVPTVTELSSAIEPFRQGHFSPGLMIHGKRTADPPPAWLESEDALLAQGLDYYDTDWGTIQARLLPSKSVSQIVGRFKNRTSRAARENPIKRYKLESQLTGQEQQLVLAAVRANGQNWELIKKTTLPYRSVGLLRRFYKRWLRQPHPIVQSAPVQVPMVTPAALTPIQPSQPQQQQRFAPQLQEQAPAASSSSSSSSSSSQQIVVAPQPMFEVEELGSDEDD